MNPLFSSETIENLKKETPFFLFSKEKMVERLREFKDLFPSAEINYALKANAEPEVLQTLADAGSGFEVASVYELRMLQKIGVPAERMIFGTSVKSVHAISEFFAYGVDRFAFDSLHELEKIAAAAPKSRVYVRVHVDDTGSVFKLSGKFGTQKENALPLLLHAKELGLIPYGISFHVGSQALNPNAWADAIHSISPILDELNENDITLEVLDIGGGQPHTYPSSEFVPSLADIAKTTLDAYKKLSYQPKLILEPGRALVADTAVLIVSVIAKIEREDGTWLFLDAGAYNALFETMAYQGSMRYTVTSLRHSYDAGESLFILTGPTGDSIDIIAREAHLPTDIDVGDKLIIHDVGAYSLSLASEFNGFPKPAVYLN